MSKCSTFDSAACNTLQLYSRATGVRAVLSECRSLLPSAYHTKAEQRACVSLSSFSGASDGCSKAAGGSENRCSSGARSRTHIVVAQDLGEQQAVLQLHLARLIGQ